MNSSDLLLTLKYIGISYSIITPPPLNSAQFSLSEKIKKKKIMYYKALNTTGSGNFSDNMKFPEAAPSGVYEVGVIVSGTSSSAVITAFNIADEFGKLKSALAPLIQANYPLTYAAGLGGYFPNKPQLTAGQTFGIYHLAKHSAVEVISVKFFVPHTKGFSEDVFNAEIDENQAVDANVRWYVKQISE